MSDSSPDLKNDGLPRTLTVVAQSFGLPVDALTGSSRGTGVALARHLAMYLCKHYASGVLREWPRWSYPEIGRAFGGRDHTTVLSAIRRIEMLRKSDPFVQRKLDALGFALDGPTIVSGDAMPQKTEPPGERRG